MTALTVYFDFRATSPLMTAVRLGSTHFSVYDIPAAPSVFANSFYFNMKYSPSESGHFDGQCGYGPGYISIESFIDAARSGNTGCSNPSDYDKHGLPTIANTAVYHGHPYNAGALN
jgi:hypothetical protein